MRHYNQSELDIFIKLFPNISDKELGQKLGRSSRSISTKARKLGLKKNPLYIQDVYLKVSQNIKSGPYRHKFSKDDPRIRKTSGIDHPRWISDRSKIKGPRRRQFRFSKTVQDAILSRSILCSICNKETAVGDREFDHITPVCIGGSSLVENCQLLCKDCHKSKTEFEQSLTNNFNDLSKLQEVYSFIARDLL